MALTTKKGDNGVTSLLSRRRVFKDNIRVEICGTLDELCSFLGMSKSLLKDRKTKKIIESLQRDLFVIGAEIATDKNRISGGDVKRLEAVLKALEGAKTFDSCCFYLPGKNLISSVLDVSRAVARRLERKAVTLKRAGGLRNPRTLVYLNRLSDLLYLLARSFEGRHEKVKTG